MERSKDYSNNQMLGFSFLTISSFSVICGGSCTSGRGATFVVLPVIIIMSIICPATQTSLKVTVDAR